MARLRPELLEDRVTPARLEVAIIAASTSATGAESRSFTGGDPPNVITALESVADVSAGQYIAASIEIHSNIVGPLLSAETSIGLLNTTDTAATAAADGTLRVRIVADEPGEVGRPITLIAAASAMTDYRNSPWAGAARATYVGPRSGGTILDVARLTDSAERRVALAAVIGDEWTFRALATGEAVNDSYTSEVSNVNLEVGFALQDSLIESLAVSGDMPLADIPDRVWPATGNNDGPGVGFSFADRLPGTAANPAGANPNGVELRPLFAPLAALPDGTEQVRFAWAVHRIRSDGTVEDVPYDEGRGQGTDTRPANAVAPNGGVTPDVRYAVPTPDEVGRFELQWTATALTATGGTLVDQTARHRLFVTYAEQPTERRERWIDAATLYGATPGAVDPTADAVRVALTAGMYANPKGWKYSVFMDSPTFAPAATPLALLSGATRYAQCGVLASTWVSLARCLGIPGIEIHNELGKYRRGMVLNPGLVPFDRTATPNARPLLSDGTPGTPDTWIWQTHTVALFTDPASGEKTVYDPTYGVSYPFDARYDPDVGIIRSSVTVDHYLNLPLYSWKTEPDATGIVFFRSLVYWPRFPSAEFLTGMHTYYTSDTTPPPPRPFPGGFRRQGDASVAGHDGDGDGRFESLRTTVTVTGPAGNYFAAPELFVGDVPITTRGAADEWLHAAVPFSLDGTNPTTVTLDLSGQDIHAAGLSGAGTLRLVFGDAGGSFDGVDSITTPPLDPAAFGESAAELGAIAPSYTAAGALTVAASVAAFAAGDYTLTATRFTAAGVRVDAVATTRPAAGTTVLAVNFPATVVPGPYVVVVSLANADGLSGGTDTVTVPAFVPPPVPPIPSEVLYATADRSLYRQTTANAAVKLGTLPFAAFDIAVGPDGTAFALESINGVGVLHRLTFGAGGLKAVRVGELGVFANSLDVRADGALFAAGNDRLYRIDPATGAATEVSRSPFAVDAAGDLAFAPNGAAYLTSDANGGELVYLAPDLATWSVVGRTGFTDISGLRFDGGTRLIGYGTGGKLYLIDQATAATTNTGFLSGVGDVYGAAVGPVDLSALPPNSRPVAPLAMVGVRLLAAGADRNGGGVSFYNPDGSTRFTADPFPGFTGGIRTAAADFNGDGVADIVAGTGPGRATRVVILDGVTIAELFSVDPFEAAFTGGVYVTAGDLNGDGKPDLVITPDEGGGPRVDIYSGSGFGKLASFFGIDDPIFRGGARASTGDMTGDGRADLIVVAGFGGGPRVAGFDGKSVGGTPNRIFGDFFAFEQALRNGIFVTVGDLDGDGHADLICGGGPGGGPRVLAFSGKGLIDGNQLNQLANFFGGDPNSRGGIRLAVKDLDGDNRADLVVGAGAGAGSRVTSYLGKTIPTDGPPSENYAFDAFSGFTGGVFVG